MIQAGFSPAPICLGCLLPSHCDNSQRGLAQSSPQSPISYLQRAARSPLAFSPSGWSHQPPIASPRPACAAVGTVLGICQAHTSLSLVSCTGEPRWDQLALQVIPEEHEQPASVRHCTADHTEDGGPANFPRTQ